MDWPAGQWLGSIGCYSSQMVPHWWTERPIWRASVLLLSSWSCRSGRFVCRQKGWLTSKREHYHQLFMLFSCKGRMSLAASLPPGWQQSVFFIRDGDNLFIVGACRSGRIRGMILHDSHDSQQLVVSSDYIQSPRLPPGDPTAK